jgi:hypothetical protein
MREMSIANPLWRAPRINGELLKHGIDIGQTEIRVSHGDVSLRSPMSGHRETQLPSPKSAMSSRRRQGDKP